MNKRDYIKSFFIIIFIITFYITSFLLIKFYYKNDIKNIILDENNNIIIDLIKDNKSSCYVGNNLNNAKWTESKENKCLIEYKDEYNKIYIKNIFGKIFEYNNNYDLTKVIELEITNNKIFLAINGKEKIKYNYETLGKVDDIITFESSDENIAKVDEKGVITGVNNGIATIKIKYKNMVDTIDVTVTNLIETMPNEYNHNKEFLGCNKYTKEENDLLDEILKVRVENAGYQTRAGVVAAARFLALEFPYKIKYFSENGRLDHYGAHFYADGEGRYYHQGLYLHESRYKNLVTIANGPGTWGCNIYSIPSGKYEQNGLDCSGFITWILLNGGFDCGDVGAGITSTPDMTDLGTKIWITNSIFENKIKAGDLLSGADSTGGHIALVAGIDENNYYVAESLWYGTGYYGAVIRTYSKNNLPNYFYWHIDMDEYYKTDGNYTEYWNN